MAIVQPRRVLSVHGGTMSSNPLCSSAESATNLVAAGGVARGWDPEFESALLQRRVLRILGPSQADKLMTVPSMMIRCAFACHGFREVPLMFGTPVG